MKRFLVAGFVCILLILTGCWGGSPGNNFTDESYWADGELTQDEVRGHYYMLFQADDEESFSYPVDFITLDAQLAMVLGADQSSSLPLSFDSYDSRTGTAKLEHREETADGIYTHFWTITFTEKNGELVFDGTCTVEMDGVVEKEYTISGSVL